MMSLTSCPLSTSVPLIEEKNAKKMPKEMEGVFETTDKSALIKKCQISKTQRGQWQMDVSTKGEDFFSDTESFNIWLTAVNNKNFLIVEEVDLNNKSLGKFYLQHIKFNSNGFDVNDINLTNFNDVKDIASYNKVLELSMKTDSFMVKDVVHYIKQK